MCHTPVAEGVKPYDRPIREEPAEAKLCRNAFTAQAPGSELRTLDMKEF